MIRAVARVILFVLVCMYARAENLDEAARALAKKVLARLGPTESARVTSRNLSSLAAGEASKAQAAFDRALTRRIRNPTPVDISLTIAENVRGYLLVAEIRRESATAVDMVEFRPDPSPAATRPALVIEKKLVWEQPTPILDLALVADQMLVLDSIRIARYERNGAKWDLKETAALAPSVRDPRGRLEIAGDSFSAELPGTVCTGTWKPALAMQCDEGGRFSAERNTIDLHDWRGAFFQSAAIGNEVLVGEMDGRMHIYDSAHAPAGVFDGWGSDFVALADSCGGSHVAATAPGDRQSADSIALYDVVNHAPVRAGEPLSFPGPVTALWPAGTGAGLAIAVAGNVSTGSYAAYALAIDCGR